MRRGRGMTLIEICLVLGLLTTVAFLGVLNMRGATVKAGPEAMAREVAGVLSEAQERARDRQVRVAVCLPSDDGRCSYSRALRVAEGGARARVVRTVDFSTRYPQQVLAAGLVTPGSTLDPADALTAWLGELAWDYCLVFEPDGSCHPYSLPTNGGAVPILVCAGLQVEAAGPPSGADPLASGYFSATTAFHPWTVWVRSSGSVRLEKGPPPGTSEGHVALPPNAALPPLPKAVVNEAPVLEGIETQPPADPTLAGGAIQVDADGSVTLRAEASDADGDELTAEWTASRGVLSSTGRQPMQFDEATGRYYSLNQWRAPEGAGATEEFALNCVVRDSHEATADNSAAGVRPRVRIGSQERIMFSYRVVGTLKERYGAASVRLDGSGVRRVYTRGAPFWHRAARRWGRKNWIMQVRDKNETGEFFEAEFVRLDGTAIPGTRRLARTVNSQGFDRWAQIRDLLAVADLKPLLDQGIRVQQSVYTDRPGTVRLMRGDVTTWEAPAQPQNPPVPYDWSPSLDKVVFNLDGSLIVVNADGSNPRTIATIYAGEPRVRYGPDPDDVWIWYWQSSHWYRIREDGSENTLVIQNKDRNTVGLAISADGKRGLVTEDDTTIAVYDLTRPLSQPVRIRPLGPLGATDMRSASTSWMHTALWLP